MKKLCVILTALVMVLSLGGCAENGKHSVKITIAPGSTETYAYSEEEISAKNDTILISAGEGLGDTEVVLMPVEAESERVYEPTYLTPGVSAQILVERDAWFRVGVNMQNPTDEEKVVYVDVEDAVVRIQ